MPLVSADDEWSPLRSVILGRAENSCFPSEPAHMIAATMPSEFHARFEPNQPFPPEIIREAATELENFASILKREGVNVHRPKIVDWKKSGRLHRRYA